MKQNLQRACVLAAAGALWLAGEVGGATNVLEPPIMPTVHPVLTPTSAINLPLDMRAEAISVWRHGSDQRILLEGNVVAKIGYRLLTANNAAVTLTPTREGGDNTFDVAIFLSGNVRVQEGMAAKAPATTATELLVTTRITNAVNLSGASPVSQMQEDNPVVKRGDVLRDEILNRPAPQIFLPNIVITETEEALQNGWIARGAGNRIIAGPTETSLAQGPEGSGAAAPPGATTTAAPAVVRKPRPQIFATADVVRGRVVDNERVVIMNGGFYLMYTETPGGTPYEFRAQRAVLFGAHGETITPESDQELGKLAKNVSGAYLEGDVTIEMGNRTIHAERIYFDFTSMRAVMLDAILSSVDEKRNIPVYMRASEIRMISRREFVAKNANFSTSEFYTPHYHIGASDAYLQDITPRDENDQRIGPMAYGFKAKNTTFDIRGVPVFWWPYLSGDTSKNDIPLRKAKVGYNERYGMSIETDWDLFGLFGQREPKGVRADLDVDYFGKRGPAGGVDARWLFDDANGLLRSHIMEDQGTDRLSRDRDNLEPEDEVRGRVTARHKMALDENWTLSLEGSYISDPNYLEEFFPTEFEEDKENETAAYLKYAKGTEALTFLGKWSLFDFTANADLVFDQYTTEKEPEVKYWRIGDSILDVFTYYSENGAANIHQMFTNYPPAFSGLQSLFPAIPPNETFRQWYLAHGYTNDHVLRGDSRHELDMPLTIGDLKITPYVAGRVTAWDQDFPEPNDGGNTTRLWGQAGVRGSMQFWRVYDDVESQFWDVHRIRHVIEPEFQVFQTGSTVSRGDLQPFDPDVEDISNASGAALTLHQKWQTKRGGQGHWRNVDWIVLNVQAAGFWHKQESETSFFDGDPLRGYLFSSRPELSRIRNSLSSDLTWRVGEWTRYLAEESYNFDDQRLEQLAQGIAIDQSPYLSYFVGNRYIRELRTDEWTFGFSYDITRKYTLSATQSYDFQLEHNILTSFTLLRKMPRFNAALTMTYDANMADTTFVVTVWPEGLPELGLGSSSLMRTSGQ